MQLHSKSVRKLLKVYGRRPYLVPGVGRKRWAEEREERMEAGREDGEKKKKEDGRDEVKLRGH